MNKKVSELTEAEEVNDDDIVMILQNNENKQVKVNKISENDTYYKAGDTETIARTYCGGILTSSKAGLRFNVTLPKKVDNVSIEITGGEMYVRQVGGGYLLNGDSILEGETININYSYGNSLVVILDYSTAFDATNNTPIGVEIQNLQLSFSEKA